MAISVNNPQTTNSTGSSVTLSSYAVGSETNRILVVLVTSITDGSDPTVDSVVFNTSESLTQSANRSDNQFGFRYRVELWYLLDPSNATANIEVTFSGSTDVCGINAYYLDGAEQQAPEATNTAEDLTTPHTVSITTVTDGALISYGALIEANGEDASALTESGLTEASEVIIDATFGSIAGHGYEIDASAGAESGGWEHNGSGGTYAATLVTAAFEEASTGTYTLVAEQGSYSVSGQASSLVKTSILTAEQGAYVVTGQTVILTAPRRLTAESGTYELTGYPVEFTYTHLPDVEYMILPPRWKRWA